MATGRVTDERSRSCLQAAGLLGLGANAHAEASFVRTLAGGSPSALGDASWATPYALSIYGHEMLPQVPHSEGHASLVSC